MTLDRDLVASALPAYEIGRELGRGAWGIVLAGRHKRLERDVAIKELPRAFAADPDVRSRFGAEARLLASLDHPHIVPIYDYVEQDGLCLLVMERLTGGTVGERLPGLSAPSACAVTIAASAALDAAHRHGVLHRDVKPDNLMFSSRGTLKVTDFGIAKVLGGTRTVATRAGEVLGTPAYMAPEQAMGAELGPATDVYATATVLYEMLSGSLPFADEESAMALLYARVHHAPRSLRDAVPGVPEWLAEVVMRGLARDPGERYASAEAFGVAVAQAATAEWGAGWLADTSVPVTVSGRIAAATERPSGEMPATRSGAATAASSAPADTDNVPAAQRSPTVLASAAGSIPAAVTVVSPGVASATRDVPRVTSEPARLAPVTPANPGRRRWAIGGAVTVVVTATILAGVLALAGGAGREADATVPLIAVAAPPSDRAPAAVTLESSSSIATSVVTKPALSTVPATTGVTTAVAPTMITTTTVVASAVTTPPPTTVFTTTTVRRQVLVPPESSPPTTAGGVVVVVLEGDNPQESSPFTVVAPWRIVWRVEDGQAVISVASQRDGRVAMTTVDAGTSVITIDRGCAGCRLIVEPQSGARYRVAVLERAA